VNLSRPTWNVNLIHSIHTAEKQSASQVAINTLNEANHLDYSKIAIRQSNFMTNILPQAANMNRGA